MDLKIEIRKLNAIHEATIRFDHAIKESGKTGWTDFTPSRFIYAFFTFNSIYSFDWEESFKGKEALKWHPDGKGRVPTEVDQFKAYLRYADNALKPHTAQIFSTELARLLDSYGVDNPIEELREVDLVNATKSLKTLALQMPGEFRRIALGKAEKEEFYPSACAVFKFVYEVRCNLFHGSKTTVQLLDSAQQRRLLIYTATLIAGNSLLFRVAEKAEIGWRDIKADFVLPTKA